MTPRTRLNNISHVCFAVELSIFFFLFFFSAFFEMRFRHHHLNLATTFALPMANGNRQIHRTYRQNVTSPLAEPSNHRLTFQLKCERITRAINLVPSDMFVVSIRLCDDHFFFFVSSVFMTEMPFFVCVCVIEHHHHNFQ